MKNLNLKPREVEVLCAAFRSLKTPADVSLQPKRFKVLTHSHRSTTRNWPATQDSRTPPLRVPASNPSCGASKSLAVQVRFGIITSLHFTDRTSVPMARAKTNATPRKRKAEPDGDDDTPVKKSKSDDEDSAAAAKSDQDSDAE